MNVILFSVKIKKNITNLPSTELAQRVVKVKQNSKEDVEEEPQSQNIAYQ